jgi:CheY-like chemotaxis protein
MVMICTSYDDPGRTTPDYWSNDPAKKSAWDLRLFRQGRRVLVVENDLMLADALCREIERYGAEVLGPAASVAEALELLRTGIFPNAAILDINLEDETVYPVADALASRDIPFIFATLQPSWAIPRSYADVPRVEKPIDMRRLAQALERPLAKEEGDPLW